MARGVNKVILIGNLGNDPEVRFMPSGGAVANLSVATNESWKDKQTGETQDRTEWHRVVLFHRLAEIAKDYLRKGSKVFIEGRLQTRKWTDKDNIERYSTEIVGNEMQMLDSRNSAGGLDAHNPPPFTDYPGAEASGDSPAASSSSAKSSSAPEPAGASANYDDDVPF